MGIFQIEFRPDDLPESRALDRHLRRQLGAALADGLPVGFSELLPLAVALRCYADTFVCLDVEEYCATVITTSTHLVSCAPCSDDPVLAALATSEPDPPVAALFQRARAAGLDPGD